MEIINEPEIKEIEERTVAYVSFVGNYLGNAKVFENLFGKLCGWAGPKQLMGTDTILMSAYYDDPSATPPEELKLDVCMAIEDDIDVEGEIKKKKLPGGKYVVMRAELTGAEEYGPAWEKIVQWLIENNLEIDMSRASYEIYLNSPDEHPEKHHIVELNIPILA
ncbi:AraC family transcriptional regulator [Methanolobus psychrotolerans]|uniref:AraC family transcriptional regulator n=1 Tax=Methanolobus psychrotolerans TaxID=1874706 RepID=UPI000B9176F6|nr:GyrI-like domain-containing protein [Methanolobus psychrotolerans]